MLDQFRVLQHHVFCFAPESRYNCICGVSWYQTCPFWKRLGIIRRRGALCAPVHLGSQHGDPEARLRAGKRCKPYTLIPTPYTRHSTPYTLQPYPITPNPYPHTLYSVNVWSTLEYLHRGTSLMRNSPPPKDHQRAVCIVLLQGPEGALFLMVEVPHVPHTQQVNLRRVCEAE